MEKQRHALVVGGTGMLRGVVLHLAAAGWVVSVIARNADALAELAQAAAAPGRVEPLPLDYSDDAALSAGVSGAIERHGPLALVVAWVRPNAPNALGIIARLADGAAGEAAGERCRFFRILGSAAADPARERRGRGAAFRALEGLAYREIVLGFRIEGESSRWNTKDEIAEGVIRAIEEDLPESVIGVVRPWEMNPRLRTG